MAALVLRRARLLTMSAAARGDAVLVRDGVIEAVAAERDLAGRARELRAEGLDLGGRTLLPAFIDAHLHVLGYAARLVSVDCSPAAVGSIGDIQEAVRRRARALPPGAWVRAAGYDELALAERRHPTRWELDAASEGHPVRLLHRSGHACVLNSPAMLAAGIDGATPEPPGGYMERDLQTGEPTGLLIEMGELVDRALPPLSPAELRAAVAEANGRLLAFGVAWVGDATHTNGRPEWGLLEGLIAERALTVGVTMMEGYDHVGELPLEAAGGRLRRGPVKVMPKELEHEFHPPRPELASLLRRITASGRSAAVHAVTRGGLDTVIGAFEDLGQGAGHRIEHCGVCSAAQADRIARLGLSVVTQPGFLHENGDLIAARLAARDRDDVYPLRRLLERGVLVAGSSDAPVVEPDPLSGLRGAVTRRSRGGKELAPGEAITPAAALALYTSAAAEVMGLARERGRIEPGLAADLVVLDQDPTAPDANWDGLTVETTIVGGRVVFERGR
jgi:predicted amidohydrolase YtcJ